MRVISDVRRFLMRRYTAYRSKARIHPTATIYFSAKVQNTLGVENAIRVGSYTHIRGHLFTYGHGGDISIGDYCFVGPRTEIWSMESIVIGNRVLISHDVNIHDGTGHSKDAAQRHAHYKHIVNIGHPHNKTDLPGLISSPIVIEDDVWINFGVTILQGVRIGRGSIIAARSIVTRDVPPESLYKCKIRSEISSL